MGVCLAEEAVESKLVSVKWLSVKWLSLFCLVEWSQWLVSVVCSDSV